MRETINTSAIILNRCAFRESDTRVTLYSLEMGRLELVARGTKKLKSKLAGHLEPITLSDIMVVPGKQFDYIGSANAANSFLNIKNDLEKLLLAGKVVGTFNKLIKNSEKDELIFILLSDFFSFLNRENLEIKNSEFIHSFFLFKLLNVLGYGFNLSTCSVCGDKIVEQGNFDYKKGGILCNTCCDKEDAADLVLVSKDSIDIFSLTGFCGHDTLFKMDDDKVFSEYIAVVNKFLKYNF